MVGVCLRESEEEGPAMAVTVFLTFSDFVIVSLMGLAAATLYTPTDGE